MYQNKYTGERCVLISINKQTVTIQWLINLRYEVISFNDFQSNFVELVQS